MFQPSAKIIADSINESGDREVMTVKSSYLLKMDSIRISVPNELIAKGLDGYKEYANLMRAYYPNAVFAIWEVSEKLVNENV